MEQENLLLPGDIIGKSACRCARAYENEAGEKVQVAQTTRLKVADE